MKQKINASFFPALLFSFFLNACNNQEKADAPLVTEPDATTSTIPAYDAAMDPVNVEAAFLKMHKDTLGIKLYEVTLNPGDSVGMHTHPDHVLYVAQGGKLRLYSEDGKSQDAELPTGAAMVAPAQSHYGKNVGTTIVKLVVADIYRPRS